jgi:hypothetical protein
MQLSKVKRKIEKTSMFVIMEGKLIKTFRKK